MQSTSTAESKRLTQLREILARTKKICIGSEDLIPIADYPVFTIPQIPDYIRKSPENEANIISGAVNSRLCDFARRNLHTKFADASSSAVMKIISNLTQFGECSEQVNVMMFELIRNKIFPFENSMVSDDSRGKGGLNDHNILVAGPFTDDISKTRYVLDPLLNIVCPYDEYFKLKRVIDYKKNTKLRSSTITGLNWIRPEHYSQLHTVENQVKTLTKLINVEAVKDFKEKLTVLFTKRPADLETQLEQAEKEATANLFIVDPKTIYDLGIVAFKKGTKDGYQLAIERVRLALKMYPDVALAERARCYSTLASSYRELNDYEKALEFCNNAINLLEKAKDEKLQDDLTKCIEKKKGIELKIEQTKKIKEAKLEEKIKESKQEVKSGKTEEHQKTEVTKKEETKVQTLNDEKAMQAVKREGVFANSTTIPPDQLYKQGVEAFNSKDYNKAIEEISLALEGFPVDKKSERALCYSTLASCYRDKQDYEQAIKYCDMAMKLYTEMKQSDKIETIKKKLLSINEAMEKNKKGFDH